AGGMIGIAAIFSEDYVGKLADHTLTEIIVTMSVFGAILMYIISMLALFKLRRSEPHMARPFAAPFYPFFPAFALLAAIACLLTMIYYNALIFGIFVAFLALGYGYFLLTGQARLGAIGAQQT
ncbi:MAG: ethanolamine permease, partial [Burkholderiales bacterium]|nr:ethanolamine permease [Burkholderiales bacterium]